jgi:hypothetical protein
MAQLITLEEAAEKLGMSPEEMKTKLRLDPDFKRLSQIRDGSTVRFKLAAIEELARQLGAASDTELPLPPLPTDELGSDDFQVTGPDTRHKKQADEPKTRKVEKGAPDEQPLDFGSTEGSAEEDVFSLTDEPKTVAQPKPVKPDSDVRLDGGKVKKPKADESAVPTEEIALDFSGPGSAVIKGGSSAKLSAPKTGGSSGKLSPDTPKGTPRQPVADSSEFELSLDADSDDFELQMNADGSSEDEVELGTLPKDPRAGKGGKSGINLRDPADSGISLEKNKGKGKGKEAKAEDSDASDVDFELSLDSSAVPSSSKLGAPKSGKLILDSDSSSEFELTLDDSSGGSVERAALGEAAEAAADKGDIFETDFEIPPMPDESGSDAVPVSDTDLEKSDFELEMDPGEAAEDASESEVVLLEDEPQADVDVADDDVDAETAAPKAKAKVKPRKKPDVDLADEDASASKVLKGVKDEDEDADAVPAGAIVERPTKPWGVLPVIFLLPSFVVLFAGALMGYELLQTMWGYQQPRKPTAPITRGIADLFDMKLNDQ